MQQPPKTTPVVVTFTAEDRLEALLEHTGDLDKAHVLDTTIPEWLHSADLPSLQVLDHAFEQSRLRYAKATEALKALKPLDVFCKEQLTTCLKGQWTVDFDVERDTLDITRTTYSSTGLFPIGYKNRETTTSRSLLHAAMENFTAEEEEKSGGIGASAAIKINAQPQTGTEITPEKFATICRELDLGALYQSHINEAFQIPVRPAQGEPVDERAGVADIRHLKLLDMQVALHIAYLKKDISQAAYTMLQSVIEQDLPAAQTQGALFDGGPVFWQGLMAHDVCLSGVMVFSKVSIDTEPKAKCVVYMPNEPRRPFYEYASLDEFKVYLTLHLQSDSYRKRFIEQFLCGHDKTDFFARFDKDRTLGTLGAAPGDTCPGDFLFSAVVGKIEADARILAVPTADVDELQRQKTLQALLNGGLLLLNAASLFVPVIGQLMLATAVIDIVSDVFEGVQDWTHGERNEALSHLLSVVENLAQLAAFAAGGKIVSSVLKKGAKTPTEFFDGFEAVTRTDGKAGLWKTDLEPYKQSTPLAAGLAPDSQGIYQDGEHASIVMDGATYRVSRDTPDLPWTLKHPVRADAFQPAVERHVESGWRHVYEHVHEWPEVGYGLARTNPGLIDLGSDLKQIADITGMSPDTLHLLHETHTGLPQRLNDCVERLRMDRKITALITAMEREEMANTDYLPEQLHTLPRLPGWPEDRFIEVRDEHEVVQSRFPETAPNNDDVNSVRVYQDELDGGKLLETVISRLYPKEVEGMIGSVTTESKAALLAKKIATSLKSNRQPLFDWLYENYDGIATGDVATLRENAPGIPARVGEELLEHASTRDRILLRNSKILGLDLWRQVREAQFAVRQDRALMGLHLPRLANADTDKLVLGLMDRLNGWGDGDRLELRQGSVSGTLLDSVGEAGAQSPGVIVKTSAGFQVTHTDGNVSSTLVSNTLLESILDALPAAQRTRMGFTGRDAQDVPALRSRLSGVGTGDPAHTRRVLRGERSDTPQHLFSCAQADPSALSTHARSLVRKVRKLYPLFTDAQVSAFLDEAGTTSTMQANRLKELGQQLKKLQAVLMAWSNDEALMKTLPGKLDDIRIARRQVAATLENCWRRIVPRGQPLTTLKLERSPVGALPTLTEQDVAHVRSLSIKDMQADDELAYFLKPFKGLVSLELDHNQLTRLPEALSHMPNLEHLSLNHNKLVLTEYTLRKLADLRELRTLGLSANRLGATPDVRKMFNLQSLFLADTHATEVPVGLSRLVYLDVADLRGNEIRELPAWLFEVPQRFAQRINLRYNPLSQTSRQKLTAYRDRTGIGMGFLPNDSAVINEQTARDLWMPKPPETTYAARNRTWRALRNEPAAQGFFQLLAEVGGSQDSRYVREDMDRRVWRVIEATQTDPGLRDQLLSMAVKANCVDSAATIFSNLEVAVNIDTVVRQSANAHDQAARLLSLGRRLFRQDYLAKIARERTVAKPGLDQVEVELAYRVGLADRLDLFGQPRHMRYESLSGVNSMDLEAAYNRVIAAEASPELLDYISQRTFWVDFLRQHHGPAFTDLAEPFHARMERAFERVETFGAGYQAHVDGIAQELQQSETGLLKRLTEAVMKADESKACFAFD